MKYYLLLSFLFLNLIGKAQNNFPQDYFRAPLDIPLYLSGNFGELRSNHFHAGLDIKTQGVEGQKVYAAADGYVSRIKVSPYGYGNALYITHPNGYTTVYGHLEKYNDKITAIVKKEQYAKEEFSVQLFPPPYQIQVKKGELVAYSGNTGGSGGPHLHFEIRETKSEHPYNPLLFGIEIKDHRAPEIRSMKIYPLDDTSTINGKNTEKRFLVKGSNGDYHLDYSYPILLYGNFGFGIESIDRMDGTYNTYGLYEIQLKKDSNIIFNEKIDEFAFSEGRYINAEIDYPYYIDTRRRIQRSYVLPGNKLRLYKNLKNEGKVSIKAGEKHQFHYTLSDYYGNTSQLRFDVEGKKINILGTSSSIKEKRELRYFAYDEKNTFAKQNLMVVLPKGVLFQDILFQYRIDEKNPKTVGPIYWLHDYHTPLFSYITVSIKEKNLSEKEKKQALIVSTTDGNNFYAEGGKWNGGNISIRTRSFGGYAVAIDSIAPKIVPLNIYPNADMSKKWSISFKITDNLSGIGSFRAEVDGKWVLMDYDAKKNTISHYFDGRIAKGQHQIKLFVRDGVGNLSMYEANFKR